MRMPTAPLVCHVLLLEAPDWLVLVDTGYGLADIAHPARRLGPYRHVIRPALDPAETAVRQIRALGYDPADVRHIMLTHFDSDHAGGLADFPQARVHTTPAEWAAARNPRGLAERSRYRPAQWAHGPNVVTHEPDGEPWRGFAAARPMDDVAPGLVMITLPGHTRGHVAYAIEGALAGERVLLHAGDSFYDHSVIERAGREPFVLRAQERAVAVNWRRVQENHQRLAELHRDQKHEVQIFSAHDPLLFERARATSRR
jgi:glyoxylase-like metal-dependent hydrolase (beta-lactamase superfamily II)